MAVHLPDAFRQEVRAQVDAAVAESGELSSELRERYEKRLEALERKEDYYLDLAGEEGWPKDKLRSKIQAIRTERASITASLEQAVRQLDTGKQVFTSALDLLDQPQAMYERGNEQVRTILNRAFFTRLYVDGRKITGQELREPFNVLVVSTTCSTGMDRNQFRDRRITAVMAFRAASRQTAEAAS